MRLKGGNVVSYVVNDVDFPRLGSDGAVSWAGGECGDACCVCGEGFRYGFEHFAWLVYQVSLYILYSTEGLSRMLLEE